MSLIKKVGVLILLVALATTGCAGLTAREKGALVGGAGGAAGGALLGAAAGNATLGAAIGGPVGLLGGYLMGDNFFQDDPGRRRSPARASGSSSQVKSQSKSTGGSSVSGWKSPAPPSGEETGGRIF